MSLSGVWQAVGLYGGMILAPIVVGVLNRYFSRQSGLLDQLAESRSDGRQLVEEVAEGNDVVRRLRSEIASLQERLAGVERSLAAARLAGAAETRDASVVVNVATGAEATAGSTPVSGVGADTAGGFW